MMSENLKKVSVIIPCYNSEKTIKNCINSVLTQSFTNIEIIIINDGSFDSTVNIIDEFKKIDSRIISVNKKNGGLSDARNCGLKNASGDYIMFIDSDDEYGENAIKSLYDIAEKNNADIVTFKFTRFKNNLDNYYFAKKYTVSLNPLPEFFKIDVSSCIKIYKREIVKDISFEFGKTSEDILFTYECFKKAKKVCLTDYVCYYYSTNGASITRSPLKIGDKNFLDSYLRIKEDFADTKKVTSDTINNKIYIGMFNLINKSAINGFADNNCETYYAEKFDYYQSVIRSNILKIVFNRGTNFFNKAQMPIVAISWRLFYFLKSKLVKIIRIL